MVKIILTPTWSLLALRVGELAESRASSGGFLVLSEPGKAV